jgi:hypothetical protein
VRAFAVRILALGREWEEGVGWAFLSVLILHHGHFLR